MRSPALLGWVRPRSERDLERFWRRAARWAGADFHLDLALVRLRGALDDAARRRAPRAYRAMVLRKARWHAWWAWRQITGELLYATSAGLTTAHGRQIERELAMAAAIDRGLGKARSRGDRILPEDDSMPPNDSLRTCCDFELTVPPHGEAIVFEPAPCEGYDSMALVNGGN